MNYTLVVPVYSVIIIIKHTRRLEEEKKRSRVEKNIANSDNPIFALLFRKIDEQTPEVRFL